MGTARDHGIQKLYNFQPTLDHLQSNLQENHIHCSNPEDFNDPWDCKPYFDPSSVADPEQRQKWIAFFKARHAELPLDQQADISMRLGPEWYENTTLLEQSIRNTTLNVWNNNAKRFRVFCLTTKPTSLLMWAHYANKHKGLCLEFNATAEKVWRARRVTYCDKLPLANASMMTDAPALLEASLLTKSTEWSYEEEYRILAQDGALDPTFSLATNGNFLKLPQGAITAVIVGSRAKLDTVREIIQKVVPGLPVKRAVQRADEFHLDIVD